MRAFEIGGPHVMIEDGPTMAAPSGPGVEARSRVLDLAARAVLVDRASTYGPPEDTFAIIANLWSAYLGMALSRQDVCALMALLKIGRLRQSPTHEDSWVDLAGYAACGGGMQED